MKDEPALLRFYYSYPYALFWICALNELFLACFFLLSHESRLKADRYGVPER